jgi:predicted ATP-grasp superfamily ATP-dependent carboligase
VVLGASETGLAVVRSLGRAGVRVIVVDRRRGPAFSSCFAIGIECPDPEAQPERFLRTLESIAQRSGQRPVLFPTADEFLLPVSKQRQRLRRAYRFNLPKHGLLQSIRDKLLQARLAERVGVPVPRTYLASALVADRQALRELPFPAIVKGREVTGWRRLIGSARKAFVATTATELERLLGTVPVPLDNLIVQEVIPGSDTEHFKVCTYTGREGEILLCFGLRKLRQCPPRLGFGSLVQSWDDPALLRLGRRLVRAIGYRGVASAEFKLDPRDGRLKLIELNPRYWQQNALADRCGMNFPLVQFAELTGAEPGIVADFASGVRWVNVHRDIDAFRAYRREGALSVWEWLSSLEPPIMTSVFAADDLVPGCLELAGEPLRRLRSRLSRLKRYLAIPWHGASDGVVPVPAAEDAGRKCGHTARPRCLT